MQYENLLCERAGAGSYGYGVKDSIEFIPSLTLDQDFLFVLLESDLAGHQCQEEIL